MHRKKVHHANHERWLVSYADFITLLFAFFVVLYASSQVDKRRVGQLAAAIQVAFQQLGVFSSTGSVPPPIHEELPREIQEFKPSSPCRTALIAGAETPVYATEDMAELRKQLQEVLAEEIKRDEVVIRMGPDGLVLSLREAGFFDSGSANVRLEAKATFSRIANMLRSDGHRLRIEGHTDSEPIHNERFASNWELSTARAIEIIRMLITDYGYPAERLAVAGYGEHHPIGDNSTAAGRRNNRRVDIVILASIRSQHSG